MADQALLEKKKDVPSDKAMKATIEYLVAKAMDGPVHRVHLRVVRYEDKIYIDMGNRSWDVIEVSKDGWKIIADSPVKFRRTSNTGALPVPTQGGNLDDLRPLMATDDGNWIKLKAVMLDAFKGKGPYFATVVTGEQGSAKSTVCKIIKMMQDPVKAGVLSSLPRDERDLAANGYTEFVLAFDNVSYLCNGCLIASAEFAQVQASSHDYFTPMVSFTYAIVLSDHPERYPRFRRIE